jgi:aldose 1-epimerase
MPGISRAEFGVLPDGTVVHAYTLTNATMSVRVLTYGATLQQINVPARDGSTVNVALGFTDLGGYLLEEERPYFGCVVGRYANRIARGQFTVDGVSYQLPVNNGANTLHGGIKGFDQKVWDAAPFDDGGAGVTMRCESADGEEGYPGSLTAQVSYELTGDNAIDMRYRALTDKPTVCTLTNHSYFNLAGEGTGDVLGHEVQINADRYLPVDETQIPTGELAPVSGTPMDFTTPRRIGERIRDDFAQLIGGKGYDHNFVLNRTDGDTTSLEVAARVVEPASGRVLEVSTTEPGMQFYTGGFLTASLVGTSRRVYRMGDGFAFETQHHPDSPNRPEWPTTVLRPGDVLESRTVYRFSTS